MLEATDIRMEYATAAGPLIVLEGISLTLAAGQSASIMGPSGCGKSTLLNILGTLEKPTAGRLTIDGQEPLGLDDAALARFRNRRVGFVFQEHHLLPQCSVLENVLLPTLAEKNAADGPSGANDDGVSRARQLLRRVGLEERIDHRPAQLSGGERQRVAIARALVNEPGLSLADEPTGSLDRASAESVVNLLLELQPQEDRVLIMVTHNASVAERVPCRFRLQDGRLEQR